MNLHFIMYTYMFIIIIINLDDTFTIVSLTHHKLSSFRYALRVFSSSI